MKKKALILSSLVVATIVTTIAISCRKEMDPGADLASCGTCSWYGKNYPVCCNTTSGWGWENNASCIAASTCTGAGQTCTSCSGSSGGSGSTTSGGTILSNGVNVQPAYYNSGNVNFGFSLMKQQSKIKTIRLELDPTAYGFSISQAKTYISNIKAQGYNLICTYHDADVLGSDSQSDLLTAANWWKSNYSNLAASGSFTVNLINEWGSHSISPATYASYYNSAISIVRQVYSGRIIIDIPGWGQETYTAYQAVKTASTRITDTNIALSTHIYPGNWNQGRNHTFQKSDLDDLANTGLPVIIGEFGNGSGSCDWSGCVDYAASKGWSRLAWAWNGDGGSLNMVTPSWASSLTATSFSTNSYFTIVYAKL
jgi:hypothetical protein